MKHNAAQPQPKNGNGKNDASNRQVAKNAKNGHSKINLELRKRKSFQENKILDVNRVNDEG